MLRRPDLVCGGGLTLSVGAIVRAKRQQQNSVDGLQQPLHSGLFSDDCSNMQVSSVEEAWQTLAVGAQSRHSAETKMNERSSRSHCMLCVKVRGQSKLTGQHSGPAACISHPASAC